MRFLHALAFARLVEMTEEGIVEMTEEGRLASLEMTGWGRKDRERPNEK